MKTYTHSFVSFMMFLNAVERRRLQKALPGPAERFIYRVPDQVILEDGREFQLLRSGKYAPVVER